MGHHGCSPGSTSWSCRSTGGQPYLLLSPSQQIHHNKGNLGRRDKTIRGPGSEKGMCLPSSHLGQLSAAIFWLDSSSSFNLLPSQPPSYSSLLPSRPQQQFGSLVNQKHSHFILFTKLEPASISARRLSASASPFYRSSLQPAALSSPIRLLPVSRTITACFLFATPTKHPPLRFSRYAVAEAEVPSRLRGAHHGLRRRRAFDQKAAGTAAREHDAQPRDDQRGGGSAVRPKPSQGDAPESGRPAGADPHQASRGGLGRQFQEAVRRRQRLRG